MIKLIAFIALLNTHSSYPHADSLPRQELFALATAVYHEARGEPLMGQAAVAHTILNRVKSKRFPNTIYDVVYQPHQFTDIRKANPLYDSRPWEQAVEIAVLTYIGFINDPTDGADHYFAHNKVNPWWSEHKEIKIVLANHTFQR